MGEVGGPRHYRGQGLGSVTSWTCPGCGTRHVTPLEDGCPVCIAEDAKRAKAINDTVTDPDTLAAQIVTPSALAIDDQMGADLVKGDPYTEVARQTLAAALAHFAEHGAPDPNLLSRPMMIGWARRLAGLDKE